jgi:hypothetical protein
MGVLGEKYSPKWQILHFDLFFKLPVSRFLAINIEGKIGQLTVRRTSSFIRIYN